MSEDLALHTKTRIKEDVDTDKKRRNMYRIEPICCIAQLFYIYHLFEDN